MGIYDFYFRWLKPQLDASRVLKKQLPPVSSFSIDANSLIHNNAQLVYAYGERYNHKYGNYEGSLLKEKRKLYIKTVSKEQLEKELFTSIGNDILRLVRAVNPTEYLFIAIDGPVPQAKVVQQRTRRFKNSKKEASPQTQGVQSAVQTFQAGGIPSIPITETGVINLDSLGQQGVTLQDDVMLFDPNAISPGTDLMVKLDTYLRGFLERHINNLTKVVYYSSHLAPGEGEHKIMDYFRQGRITGDKAHVFYGMDTDLILLTMALGTSNILLWREDVEDILDIDALKYILSAKLGGSPTAIDDFILIMNFFGNDFLPVQPGFDDFTHSIDDIIAVYKYLYQNYQITLTSRDSTGANINWVNFMQLLNQLNAYESTFLRKESNRPKWDPITDPLNKQHGFLKKESYEYATHIAHEDGTVETSEFNYDNFRNFWYHHEFTPKGDPELVKRVLGESALDITVPKIEAMVKRYLNTIAWIFGYYFNGATRINLKFFYNYYHTPLLSDVYNYMASNENWISDLNEYLPTERNVFPNVLQQLLSISPPSSVGLLPPELRVMMTDPKSELIDYYPIDFIVDYELKDKAYKGIPLIPFVDPDRILRALNSMRFSPDRFKYYQISAALELRRDPRVDQVICDTRQDVAGLMRGRGRGRGGGRGTRGGRGGRGGASRGGIQDQSSLPVVSSAPQTQTVQQTRGAFVPTYNLNQGPYGNTNDQTFELPTFRM